MNSIFVIEARHRHLPDAGWSPDGNSFKWAVTDEWSRWLEHANSHDDVYEYRVTEYVPRLAEPAPVQQEGE